MADEIPKGRLARGFALVKLAATELPSVAGRVIRGQDTAPMDLDLVRASAERAVKVLGDLRGLALKLGQTLSYVDGLLPAEATDVYQKTLSRLQSGAPTVTFAEVRAEIERGLGAPLTERFVRFDETPIAAASIGQVHRASIRDDDGREVEVAVKVQYPSIARALESDLKNLDVLRPFIAVMAPGADTDKGVDEVVEHLAAELDYNHEADNQDTFRALVESWEGVIIPRVYRTHTARNVITMDYVAGRSLREASEIFDQPTRNAIGRAVFRFSLGNALGRGVFNTDPHPGNYLAFDDGRVAFLDFGSVKVMPPALHARWRALSLLLLRGEFDAWRVESARLFGMEAMDPRARQHHQDFMLRTAAVVARDEEVTIDRALLRDAVRGGVHTAKAIGRELGWAPSRSKTVKMPHDFVMAGRMQLGLFAVLAQLRPRANWNRILRDELGVP